MKSIISDIYKLKPSDFIKEVMKRWISRNLAWLLLPVMIAVIAGVVWNSAMFYVSAMLIFIVIPSVLMFAYFNYALTENAVESILKRRVRITQSGVYVEIYDDDGENVSVRKSQHFPTSEITEIDISFGMIVITNKSRYSFTQIPLQSLGDNVGINDIYSILEDQS